MKLTTTLSFGLALTLAGTVQAGVITTDLDNPGTASINLGTQSQNGSGNYTAVVDSNPAIPSTAVAHGELDIDDDQKLIFQNAAAGAGVQSNARSATQFKQRITTTEEGPTGFFGGYIYGGSLGLFLADAASCTGFDVFSCSPASGISFADIPGASATVELSLDLYSDTAVYYDVDLVLQLENGIVSSIIQDDKNVLDVNLPITLDPNLALLTFNGGYFYEFFDLEQGESIEVTFSLVTRVTTLMSNAGQYVVAGISCYNDPISTGDNRLGGGAIAFGAPDAATPCNVVRNAATAVPEPVSLPIMLFGLIGGAVAYRTRRRA